MSQRTTKRRNSRSFRVRNTKILYGCYGYCYDEVTRIYDNNAIVSQMICPFVYVHSVVGVEVQPNSKTNKATNNMVVEVLWETIVVIISMNWKDCHKGDNGAFE